MADNTDDAAGACAPSPSPSRRDRVLDLIALLSLLTVMTVVYLATGPEVFAAVTGVSAGLFTTWRGRENDD